jgi:hypothetical protein
VIFSTGWLAVNPRQLVAGLIEKEAICGIAVAAPDRGTGPARYQRRNNGIMFR